jgi:hypothetical protein
MGFSSPYSIWGEGRGKLKNNKIHGLERGKDIQRYKYSRIRII